MSPDSRNFRAGATRVKLSRYKTWQTRPVHTAIAVVAEAFDTQRRLLLNTGSRRRIEVRARQVAMWIATELGASTPHVGCHMGFDHSTVTHARKKIVKRMATDWEFAELCSQLLAQAREYCWENASEIAARSAALAQKGATEATAPGVPPP